MYIVQSHVVESDICDVQTCLVIFGISSSLFPARHSRFSSVCAGIFISGLSMSVLWQMCLTSVSATESWDWHDFVAASVMQQWPDQPGDRAPPHQLRSQSWPRHTRRQGGESKMVAKYCIICLLYVARMWWDGGVPDLYLVDPGRYQLSLSIVICWWRRIGRRAGRRPALAAQGLDIHPV